MTTLIALFTAAALLQLIGWIVIGAGFIRTSRRASAPPPDASVPVSVIVAAKNEVDALTGLLAALSEQTRGKDEVVVVDDHSTDGTADLVRSASETDPRIRLIPARGTGKKSALTQGVENASNDVLAFTDADCIPGPGWLAEIRRRQADGNERIVAGYGPYRAGKGLLNLLVRFETLHTALLSIAATAFGKPYMAVGRNLSYRKTVFERVRGFERAADLLSGDDDLFVQAAAAEGVAVVFALRPAAFVYSEAPPAFGSWLRQKRRHLSAGRRYGLIPKLGLLAYHSSALLCWAAPFAVGWIGFACVLCRLVPGQLVVAAAASRLNERSIAPNFVPLDLAYQIYLILVAPIAWFRPPKRW